MKRLLALSLVSCLACGDPVDNLSMLPLRELHYNFETGQRIGQKILAYDAEGRLVSEHYYSDFDPIGNTEVLFEYNSDGDLFRRKQRAPNQASSFYITEFTYQDGQKKTENTFYDDNPIGYHTVYFFTGSKMDSTQLYFYASFEQEYRLSMTTYYEYDGLNIIRAFSNNGGETVYRYGDLVVSVCNLYPGDNSTTLEDCIDREFNMAGQVTKIFRRTSWSEPQLQEELFYNGTRLRERRLYSFPAYEPGNTVDIKQIQYGY